MNARDLAALAALGAVGYHLSKGKGKGKKDEVDASPEKDSGYSSTADAKSDIRGGGFDNTRKDIKRSDMDDFKGVRQPTRPGQDKSGPRSVTKKTAAKKPDVADKPAAEKPDVADKPAAEKTKSTVVTMPTGDDRFVSPEEGAKAYRPRRPGQTSAPTFSSSEAGMKNYAPRRTGQTPSAVQQTPKPAELQSMARYPGGLAKRGANVSVPEDKPITRILGTDQDYVDAITATAPVGLAAKLAAKMAYKKDKPLNYYDQPALGGPSTPLLGAPAKQLTGPSKTDLMARDRASRASERQDAMTRENADRYGLNPNAPGYDAAASSLRDRMGGRDFTLKKKGGVIKKMASGGMTSRGSSASNRGDGIAQRGKTRGSMR
jgi:hypothetical protein